MFTPTRKSRVFGFSLFVVLAGIAVSIAILAQPAQAAKPKPIITTLKSEGDFTTLLKAINSAGLDKTLHSHGPYTIFAPTDAAFAKLPPSQLNDLLANKATLKSLVGFHIIHTRLSVADLSALKSGATPNTLEGDPLRVASAAGVVTVNGAAVTKGDVPATNGIIQEVDTVLIPPTTISGPPAPNPPPASANPPLTVSPPANPPAPANPPTQTPTPDGPPATQPPPPAPDSPPMQPANPPSTPGAPAPSQPANPAPSPGSPPGSAPAPVTSPDNTNPPANSMPAQ